MSRNMHKGFVTTCGEIWYTVDGTPTLPICRETCTKGMLQHYGLAAIPSLQALRPYTGCLTPYPCYPVLSPLVACSRSLRYGVHHLLADIWCQLFGVATPNSYTKTSHLSPLDTPHTLCTRITCISLLPCPWIYALVVGVLYQCAHVFGPWDLVLAVGVLGLRSCVYLF